MLSLALIIPLIIGIIAHYFIIARYRRRIKRKERAGYADFIRTINSDIFKNQML